MASERVNPWEMRPGNALARVRTAAISLHTETRKSGGGGGGIRTRDDLAAVPVFKTGALSRTLPPLRGAGGLPFVRSRV